MQRVGSCLPAVLLLWQDALDLCSPACRDAVGNMLWEVTRIMSCSNAIVTAELQGSGPIHALHSPGSLDSRTTTCEVVATASNYPSGTG